MSANKHTFKLNDTRRLLQAAIAAGLPRERLRLVHDLLGHKISVEVRDESGGEASKGEAKNPWDEVLNEPH
jgi:hypothetical protein